MKKRFLLGCFVFVFVGMVTETLVFADSSLRWKTPKVGSNNVSSSAQSESFAGTVTPALLRESTTSQVKQVRYTPQFNDFDGDPVIPAEIAEIDTQYPESRPQPRVQVPLVQPGVLAPSRFANPGEISAQLEDLEREPLDGGLSRTVRPQLVEIQCPEGNSLKSLPCL